MLTNHNDQDVKKAYEFFGFDKIVTPKKVRDAYDELAEVHHPDNGGDSEKMDEINHHREVIKGFFKAHPKLRKNTRLSKHFHEVL